MTDVASQGPAAGEEDRPVLTDRQGHPVYDNQNQRTVGARGPATLENYQFLEKISHFDRERIPERVVHARGATAFGVFVADGTVGDEPVSRYTRAKLFQQAGKETEVAVRFSTVAGGRDSSEAARDPRGFAVKFYTEDGNWDLVGNNLGVFFIRDAIKFPDFIHSQKPDPVTFDRQVANRVFDFASQTPESIHMFSLVFSPRGLPASYRTMQGFGVNTYKWVNEAGETQLVKYHWLPKQGVKSWTAADAAVAQSQDLGVHTKDLYSAIENGDHPSWELHVQLMSDDEHPELDFDPLDDTKVWPENDFPLRKVGTMTLNRVPDNFFLQSEQIAFGTGVLVDGLDFSDDKMLVGRTFTYSDTQRHRVGPNYLQLGVNAPKTRVATNQRDGRWRTAWTSARARTRTSTTSRPSSAGSARTPTPRTTSRAPRSSGGSPASGSRGPTTTPRPASATCSASRGSRTTWWPTSSTRCRSATGPIAERMVWHLFMAEDELGRRVGEGLGITADDVRGLEPLQTQTLTEAELERAANLGKNGPRDVTGLVMTHCVPNEHVSLT